MALPAVLIEWRGPKRLTAALFFRGGSVQVTALPATMTNLTFAVTWAEQDEATGSGIARYDLFVSDNGGEYRLLLNREATR